MRGSYALAVTELIVICVLVVVVGVPFTLWWWKQADKWADAEHRRFAVKTDTRERIVVLPRESAESKTPKV